MTIFSIDESVDVQCRNSDGVCTGPVNGQPYCLCRMEMLKNVDDDQLHEDVKKGIRILEG